MKDKVQGAELSYFVEQLLPLAERIHAAAQGWKAKGREMERTTMETLEEQVCFTFCTLTHMHM